MEREAPGEKGGPRQSIEVKHIWNIQKLNTDQVTNLTSELRISSLLATALINRGFSDVDAAQSFLQPKLANLSPPEAIPGMNAAVARLLQARANKQKVVVFGDYDVDGVTSTTLLLDCLGRLGWNIAGYLPDRVDDGYGLTDNGVATCRSQHQPDCLIAADCGSTSHQIIHQLQQDGIDVIVLDHHQVSDPVPPACALVNPQLAGPDDPDFRELCTAGLAFKLVHAIVKSGREAGLDGFDAFDIRDTLDLVSLGTIADLVPLTGENRILALKGLQQLGRSQRPGIQALVKAAGIKPPVDSFAVGFQLGPRLNAAGRLDSAMDALDLLCAEDDGIATELADKLDRRNRDRQRIQKDITRQVLDELETQFDPDRDYAIIRGDTGWNIGVVGIVASKIQKEFYRPTFIFGGSPDGFRGSGRSIDGFDLAAALRECDDHCLKAGGHAMAAGASLGPDQLDGFRTRLNEIARAELATATLMPTLNLDASVPLRELNFQAVQSLEQLQPTGRGIHSVQLAVPQLELDAPVRWMGQDNQHAKLAVTDGSTTTEAVFWNAANKPMPEGRFDLAVEPSINTWRGRRTIQLKILDWRQAG